MLDAVMVPDDALDVYCDVPGCGRNTRACLSGETCEYELPDGWGQVTIRAMVVGGVTLDLCPAHLAETLQPWIEKPSLSLV